MSDKAKAKKAPLKERRESRAREIFLRLLKNKVAVVSACVLLLIILLAILAPVISPYKYDEMDLLSKNQGPSIQHLFGTDNMGRDILERVMYGGRYSLSISVIGVIGAILIGMLIGTAAGFFGGTVDNILMRLLDIIQAVPDMILTIAVSAALGSGFDKTILALAIARAPAFARILRVNVLQVRTLEYVEAAEAIGCSKWRRIIRHILPNSWTPLIVSATMQIASMILSLAALSYIGLGISQPLPEWGAMLSAARGFIRDYPYQLIFPGLAIAISVLCLNLLGDGLRDALDPKLKD